jgi:DNA-binding LacI/PurR family transcriptional regulator
MAVSIKDIARLAGVSHSTVSRALRNSPLIPAATTERIQRIARENGYSVSAIARGLRNRRTDAIGVVVTTIADPFNGEIVAGIEEEANRNEYSVILANSQADPDREIAVVRSFQERRVDGIIVASSRVGALYLPVLSELNIPTVLLNNQHPSEFVHSIKIDNREGACLATEHLVSLGHRRIAYLGDNHGLQSDVERFEGYCQGLTQAGLPCAPELTVRGDGKPAGAEEASHILLGLAGRPTAIVCYNDMSALGIYREAAQRGLRIPQDLSLVGFDDLYFAPYVQPPLTTIAQPRTQMGVQAMSLLLALMRGEEISKSIVIRGELLLRGSTATAPH